MRLRTVATLLCAGALAALGAGCAEELANVRSPADEARLASLPRVPAEPRVPVFPPELRGFSFHVEPLLEGVPYGDERMARIAQSCGASFDAWMGAAGWTPVRNPSAPAELVIVEHCMVHLSTHAYGNLVELSRPENENVAIEVVYHGAPIVVVPRGPADYACESSRPPQEMERDCAARSERWAQGRILDALIASAPLAQLASQLHR